jgi:2-polyprenyl-6-methoxyphenol hydroxylase-like FAD-dependent oxidoreductase
VALKVIVSGAGIAGLALAYWLDKLGASTLIIERSAHFQPLGHYISLKGNGVEVVRRMGILDACQARAAAIEETRMYTQRGRLLRSEPTAEMNRMLGGYLLLRRADLQAALYELARERAEFRFGRQIGKVQLGESGVEVTLNDGEAVSADLLIGSDGIHSQVRELVWGTGFTRALGGHYVAVTQALRHGLPRATHSYWGRGRLLSLFAVSEDSVSSVAYVEAGAGTPPRHDAPAMRDYLLAASQGFPDHVREILGQLTSSDFVFADVIAQIVMPRITTRRCALVGDAAHCPTFLSGMGSSLALQGALLLANCLGSSPADVPAALARYEQAVTPIAQRYQHSALRMRGLVLGRSRVKVVLRDLALRLLPQRWVRNSLRRFFDAERPLHDSSAASDSALAP